MQMNKFKLVLLTRLLLLFGVVLWGINLGRAQMAPGKVKVINKQAPQLIKATPPAERKLAAQRPRAGSHKAKVEGRACRGGSRRKRPGSHAGRDPGLLRPVPQLGAQPAPEG